MTQARTFTTLMASVLGVAILSGCQTETERIAEAEYRQEMRSRMDDLQAQVLVLQEQQMASQRAPQSAPAASSLKLRPVVPQSAPAAAEPTKKEMLAQLARESRNVAPPAKPKKTSRTRISRTSASLKSKHIKVPGVPVQVIQTGLKNAGCNPGKIDGKVGANTINAIKKFQQKEGLKADGVVGPKTWARLQQYL